MVAAIRRDRAKFSRSVGGAGGERPALVPVSKLMAAMTAERLRLEKTSAMACWRLSRRDFPGLADALDAIGVDVHKFMRGQQRLNLRPGAGEHDVKFAAAAYAG